MILRSRKKMHSPEPMILRKKHAYTSSSWLSENLIGDHLLIILLYYLHDHNLFGHCWLLGAINKELHGLWHNIAKKAPNLYKAALGLEGGRSRPSWSLISFINDRIEKATRLRIGNMFVENLSMCAKPGFSATDIREFVAAGYAPPAAAPWLNLLMARDDLATRVDDFNHMLFEYERAYDARPILTGGNIVPNKQLTAPSSEKFSFIDLAMFNVYTPLTGIFKKRHVTNVCFSFNAFIERTSIIRDAFAAIDDLIADGGDIAIIEPRVAVLNINHEVWRARLMMLRRMFALHTKYNLAVWNNIVKMMSNMVKYANALRCLLICGAAHMPTKFIEKLRRRIYKVKK